MSALKNTIRVYRVMPDTLALCETIVAACEARSECNAWLAGQALSARVSALVQS